MSVYRPDKFYRSQGRPALYTTRPVSSTYHRDLARWERRRRIFGWTVVAVIWTALCLALWWAV